MIKAARFIIANGHIPGRGMGILFNTFFMSILKRGVLAAVFGVILAVAGTAFTPANNNAVSVMYEFKSQDLDDADVPSAYEEITGTAPSCSGNALPCIITVPDGHTLSSYLSSFNGDDEAVLADATATRNANP